MRSHLVLSAIELNNESRISTQEIDNESANWHLTLEFQTSEPSITEAERK